LSVHCIKVEIRIANRLVKCMVSVSDIGLSVCLSVQGVDL